MGASSRHCRRRRGFTLLEMLIVLAVVVAVASMGWPSLRKLSHKSTLREAARQVRNVLARARLEAIESGGVRLFRYCPGTGVFEVSAGSTAEEGAAATLFPAEGSAPSPRVPDRGLESAKTEQTLLPEGVCFVDPRWTGSSIPSPAPAALDGLPGWSQPVVFFPNGRATDAFIRLECQDRYFVVVALRGLTGTVQLGPVGRLDNDVEQENQ
jgi:prepilin-type N-terminal cleavage/methylation domain-containing protein